MGYKRNNIETDIMGFNEISLTSAVIYSDYNRIFMGIHRNNEIWGEA